MVVLMERRHRQLWGALAVAAVLASAPLATMADEATADAGDERRVIRITAERFAFSPSEIELREGEEVEFRVRSDDTSHGFRIIGSGVKVAVPKRGKGEVSVVFKAGAAGRYTFECYRMCGAGHDFMRGVIIVRAGEGADAK
jgi:cytochrome c oxidase subunit 2